MLTPENGVVSVWIGVFPSEKTLSIFVSDVYYADGDTTSPFRTAFELGWYDEDQREIGFRDDPGTEARQLVVGPSYWESFGPALVPPTAGTGNSVVLVYDHRFVPNALVPTAPLRFVASLPYEVPRQVDKPWLLLP